MILDSLLENIQSLHYLNLLVCVQSPAGNVLQDSKNVGSRHEASVSLPTILVPFLLLYTVSVRLPDISGPVQVCL